VRIARQVVVEGAPTEVAEKLATSRWKQALRIEPAGAGSRVIIDASASPPGVARAVEDDVLAEVCRIQRMFGRESRPTRTTTTTTRTTTRSVTMTTIKRSVTIDAADDKVWAALADFGAISTWNPGVKTSALTSTAQTGIGITRQCQLAPTGTVDEVVTDWEEGRRLTVEITEFKGVPGMRSATAYFELAPGGAATEVKLRMDYAVGLGAIGAGMNAMVMRRQFGSAASRLLAGLKLHVESGLPVGRKDKLPLDAVA